MNREEEEESHSERDDALNHAEEEVEREYSVRDGAYEAPSVEHGDEHVVEEEYLLAWDDYVEDDVEDPEEGCYCCEDAEGEPEPCEDELDAVELVGLLEVLVVALEELDGLAPAVVLVAELCAALPVAAALLDGLADLVELDGLLPDHLLALLELLLRDALGALDPALHEVERQRHKADPAEHHHEQVPDDVDHRHEEQQQAHPHPHVPPVRPALLPDAPSGRRSAAGREEPAAQLLEGDLGDAKEDVEDGVDRDEDKQHDHVHDEGPPESLGEGVVLLNYVLGLVVEGAEGKHDHGENPDERVEHDPDRPHGKPGGGRTPVGDVQRKKKDSDLAHKKGDQ